MIESMQDIYDACTLDAKKMLTATDAQLILHQP